MRLRESGIMHKIVKKNFISVVGWRGSWIWVDRWKMLIVVNEKAVENFIGGGINKLYSNIITEDIEFNCIIANRVVVGEKVIVFSGWRGG